MHNSLSNSAIQLAEEEEEVAVDVDVDAEAAVRLEHDGAEVKVLVRPKRERGRQQSSQWCRTSHLLSTVALIFALLLIVGAIVLHLKQKHHLGRLHIERPHDLEADSEAMVSVAAQIATDAAVAASDETRLRTGTQCWEPEAEPAINDECLRCIAETATGNRQAKCSGGLACGIYRISQAYWQDALPAALQQQEQAAREYASCVLEPRCAAAIVRGYLEKYGRDCNGDGLIECRDHIRLHMLGPTGCSRAVELQPVFNSRMSACLR